MSHCAQAAAEDKCGLDLAAEDKAHADAIQAEKRLHEERIKAEEERHQQRMKEIEYGHREAVATAQVGTLLVRMLFSCLQL